MTMYGGDAGSRTPDLRLMSPPLYQLSYIAIRNVSIIERVSRVVKRTRRIFKNGPPRV